MNHHKNNQAQAVMTVSPHRGFLSGNEATIKLFACENERDFISRSPATLSPLYQPDGELSMPKAQRMMSLALEKGEHFFAWMHKRATGQDFPVTVLLTRLESGSEAKLQAIVRETAEFKEVEGKQSASLDN